MVGRGSSVIIVVGNVDTVERIEDLDVVRNSSVHPDISTGLQK